jgi:hypothetical protein
MQIYKPVLRPTMMTTDFPDLGLKVMISNTPSEITPRQQTSHGRLTETRRQPKTLKKNPQQHSIIGLSQIGQTHTTLSRDFGSTKSPSVTQALAAAKAEKATWQEVLCIRRRTEDLKRIAQTGRTVQGPTAQGDGVYFSRHQQKLTGHPYLQVVSV